MRVLFITAYFPPCQYGWGYMRICEQVADGLAERGHEVSVLTSTYQDGPEVKPYPVYRHLTIEPDWLLSDSPAKQFFVGRKQREQTAVSHLHQTIANFKPDALFVWDAFGLSDVMLREAEESGIPVAYYFANYLPEFPGGYVHYWSSANSHPLVKLAKLPISLLAKTMLAQEGKPIKLKYEHTISVSDYVRQRLLSQKLIGPDAIVAPNAVDLEMFSGEPRQPEPNEPLRCLVAGRVAPEKGIHAVKAAAEAVTRIVCGRIGDVTVNVGAISGGGATNIVPDRCAVTGEIRSNSDEKAHRKLDEISDIIRKTAEINGASVEFESTTHITAYRTDLEHPVVKRFQDACKQMNLRADLQPTFGGSDHNLLALHGISGIVLATAMNNCHSCTEYTSEQEICRAAELALALMTAKQ